MNARHLIGAATTTLLLVPTSGGVVATEGAPEVVQASGIAGPLPAAVQRATERFRDVKEAIAAGYVQPLGCVSGPNEGAMGVHYLNPALMDDVIDVTQPEALVYEPKPNGRLDLVAVEYIVPADAWGATHAPGAQPGLMGHLMHLVNGPNRYGPGAFYELHVWAWRHNAHGAFADWNPNVSCVAWEGAAN